MVHVPTSQKTQNDASRIQLTRVSYEVAGKSIISGLTVDIAKRRIGVVGRNGSGKSTVARLLSGLIAPTSGAVTLNGNDVTQDRKTAIREVGILFQNPDHQIIFPTVDEEIGFGLTQLGLSKTDAQAKVDVILRTFQKTHWSSANIHALSQGQKQLVCLMSILAMEPKVIILDEPFSGLDIPTRLQLAAYFDQIEATLVHITHDPDNLRDYDHVIWLEDGTIKQSGDAATVLPTFEAAMIQLGAGDDLTHLSD